MTIGLFIGIFLERNKWNELIADGKLPKPNDGSAGSVETIKELTETYEHKYYERGGLNV